MQFHDPQYLWLLLLVPLYLAVAWWRRRNGFYTTAFEDLVRAQKKSATRLLPPLRHALAVLFIVSSVLALARPQEAYHTRDITKRGIDIVVALDISESMRAEDLSPNRLEAAKSALDTCRTQPF